MPANAVTIDQTWIDGAGDAPWLLNAPNTVYTLAVDVDLSQAGFYGQVFELVGDEIVLDLNGHSVRVGGKAYPQVTDSMLYRRTSEHTVRVDDSKDLYTFGGKVGTGIGLDGTVVDVVPASDLPLINKWARTK